jgi:gentisate 1,2-dioxygenase
MLKDEHHARKEVWEGLVRWHHSRPNGNAVGTNWKYEQAVEVLKRPTDFGHYQRRNR